jgi:transcriptional regulator with XRE-family HTH domain
MRSEIAKALLAKTPEEIKIFTKWYASIQVRIHQLLKEKGLTQKALAQKLEKQPSEIHKWLNGDHNFTLRSLAKLQAELGEVLIEVPPPQPATTFTNIQFQVSVSGSMYRKIPAKLKKNIHWTHPIIQTNNSINAA